MAVVTAFCLTNLPFHLSDEEFKIEVLRIWGPQLKLQGDETKIDFKLYQRDGNQRKGTVCGFPPTSFSLLLEISREERFKGRNICLKPDSGEERDDFGRFQNAVAPLAIRERAKTLGVNYNKMFLVFNPELIEDLGHVMVFRKTLILTPALTEVILKIPGQFTIVKLSEKVPEGSVSVRYCTVLETMQAMLFLSGNLKLCDTPVKISNPFNTVVCKTKLATGLGTEGCILDLLNLKKNNGGYIPFGCFNQKLLNLSYLKQSEEKLHTASKCWRCNTPFKLLGVDMDLGFIAGKCVCAYSDHISNESQKTAYAWNNENFTRLVSGNQDKDSKTSLRVSHIPMLKEYATPFDYRRVVLPLLEDEWKVASKKFKESHRIKASLMKSIFVETIKIKKKGKEKKVDVYALKLFVEVTKLWCIKERSALRKIYLPLSMKKDGQAKNWIENHKGRIRTVFQQKEVLILHVQAHFATFTRPQCPQILEISAKANKYEYKYTRKILKKWAESKIDTTEFYHPYLQLLLNPCNRFGWELPVVEKEVHLTIQDQMALEYLVTTLNTAQRESLEKAISHSLSVIQGPPGTGKTHNASVLAIVLATTEIGTVVACAPSNEAADNLAEKIGAFLLHSNIQLSVLRVEAKSREIASWESFRGVKKMTRSKPYDVLHDLVAVELETCTVNDDLARILGVWKNGESHILKREEREALECHIAKIEKSLAKMFAIQIYTVATLGDGRAKSFSRQAPVTTILVDEVGQSTQPSLLMFEELNPVRVVLTGDHLQLPPHVESQSAAEAGLNKSCLELASSLYLGNKNNSLTPPWTMLVEQYRMTSEIRYLVSEVTYDGKLLDAEYIQHRPSELPSIVSKQALVLLNHNCSEIKVGQSYKNPGEADMVVEYVCNLLALGVKSHLITILSLYEAQNSEIKTKLKIALPDSNLQVINVDAFQGRENAIVIVSFTRSNKDAAVGFTKSPNRINVAISRAKEVVVLAVDMNTFGRVATRSWNILSKMLCSGTGNC